MSFQFVACANVSCPYNEQRQCRAASITVSEEAECLAKDEKAPGKKSGTENYVDIKECRCKECRSWEIDEYAKEQVGQCGFRADLLFNDKGLCNEKETQIKEPGFMATLE